MNGGGNKGRPNPNAAPRNTQPPSTTESQRGSYAPSKTDLQAEIARRASRSQAHSTGIVNQASFGQRPDKPDSLKARDEHGKSLTAHHMLPHSKIKQEFGNAVRGQNLTAIQNISTFGGKTIDSSDAHRATAFYKTQKNDTVNQTQANLTSMYKAASWDQNNVFMGPNPDKRADDPGDSGVDVRRNSSGQTSAASKIAQYVMTHGFGAQSPQDFASQRAASTQEANTLRPYKSSDWESAGSRTTRKGATINLTRQK